MTHDQATPHGGGGLPAEKHVCFQLAGQAFAAPVRAVKETISVRPLTRVFLVPPFVAGLMNLRGEVVAVLDLAQMVGLERRARDDAAVVILRAPESWSSRAQGQDRAACGLAVDRLLGVRDVSDDSVKPPPPNLDAEAASYLRGVATLGDPPAALAVLDAERVLESDRLKPYRRQK